MKDGKNSVHAVGVDLGGTNVRAILVNDQGTILQRGRSPTEAHLGPERVVDHIASLVCRVLEEGEVGREMLLGVGVGTPGPLNPYTGIVHEAPNLPGWQQIPLRDLLQAKLGAHVQIENDANAAALGEYWFGAGRGAQSLVCLTLGTGLGGGIVLKGEIWRGATYMAGEIGHMVIQRDGPLCGCGNRGCLEAMVSATGLRDRVRERLKDPGISSPIRSWVEQGEEVTPERLYREAVQGDPFSQEILREAGKSLGTGLTNVIHILNPEVIVLTGGLMGAREILLEVALKEVQAKAFPWAARQTRIVPGNLGDDAGALGAAALLFASRGNQ
ncbi:MAG: ROK family protein [Candidatus Tectomicrobia bacterium]|uniref:ROK family protein n=1 Tax=Tectimicrobiota bacterium TaxID=2528274 RepID=A0A932CRJ6_UNCTE|nr:ROK family protein [Candidatus Tectomicrobia bacterium]